MTKVNKMFKAITVFVVIAMLASFLPVAAAANTVEISAEAQQSKTDPIVVTGNIASGNELTILAVRTDEAVTGDVTEALGMLESIADGEIMYIDQVTSDGEGEEFSFRLRNDANAKLDGDYLVVFMGGTDADAKYTSIELVEGAPEDLAVSADSYTGNVEFTFTDDADWREAVEVTVTGAEGAVDCEAVKSEGSIKLALAAGTYDITFTAAGYFGKTFENVVVADRAAGTATLSGDASYLDNETITLTLDGTNAHSTWTTVIKDYISVVDAVGTTAGTIAFDGNVGTITIDDPNFDVNAVNEYKVVFDTVAGYADIEDIEFTVSSYGAAVAAEAIAAVTSAANAEDEEGLTWLITVPVAPIEGFEGEYTFAWAIDPEVAPAENVYTITRAEDLDPEADESVTYALTVTVTYAGEEYTATKDFVVNEQGADGPTVGEVTILKATDAYGLDKALVKVVIEEGVDVESQGIVYGEYAFYYSSEKSAFYGLVPEGTTVDDITGGIELDETGDAFFFSVIVTETKGDTVGLRDMAFAGRTSLNRETPTDKQWIAMDVAHSEPDGQFNTRDIAALGKGTLGTTLPVIAVVE